MTEQAPEVMREETQDQRAEEMAEETAEEKDNRTFIYIIENLGRFLSCNDLMNLNKVSKECKNLVENKFPKFQKGLKGKLQYRWYSDVKETEKFENTYKWNSCELHHFFYRGNKCSFKNYWEFAASLLDKLIISRCSMECDGFELLLDQCPVLQTLVLSRSNFRDLDDFHNDDRYHKNFPKNPDAKLVRHGIRNLTIEYVYKIEDCFMNYLIRRTGNIESLVLKNCFIFPVPPALTSRYSKEMQTEFSPRPSLTERFVEFEKNLCNLIAQNLQTLTKVELHMNNYQAHLFSILNTQPGFPVWIQELAITLVPEVDYNTVIQFMNNCSGLEKFILGFDGHVTNDTVNQMLNRHQNTLKSLELIFVGDRIVGTCLQLPSLRNFHKLKYLKIMDSKKLTTSDIHKLLTRRKARVYHHVERTIESRDKVLARIGTNVNPDFLENLPASLKELAVCKYITSNDFIKTLATNNPKALESFRKLTKLEIRGPWVHSIEGIFMTISQELKDLETLTLIACEINDTHITDLSLKIVKELRQCITLGLVMHTTENGLPGEDVLDNINMRLRQTLDSTSRRRRLSNLNKLKYLDLSSNTGISDVSLFDGMVIPGLLSLSLNGCYKISDSGMEFITCNFPELVELSVRNCCKLSKYGLNRVVTKCRKLKTLNTTRSTRIREVPGFVYNMNPNYYDIVKIKVSNPIAQLGADDDA